MGTSTARVILFRMIPTTIPPTTPTTDLPVIHEDTPLTLTISPTIPPVAPTIQYTSLFINTDSSDSDTLDSPPSQDPYKTVVSQWRSRVAATSSPPSSPIRQILPTPPGLPRRPAVLALPGQPIPIGRPYRTQPNGVLKMLTDMKYVGSLPTHRLASRYPSDSSSSDSSSSYSSSGYAISETSCDSPTAASESLSRKRCRSLSVPISSLVRGALSPVRADLLPPPKRIRDSDSVMDLEFSSEDGYEPYVPKEVGLGVDIEDSYEPYTEPDIDSDIQADIDECITYADAIRARGIDDRDVVKITDEEEVESREKDTVEVEVDRRVGPVIEDDVREPVRDDVLDHVTADGAVEVINETLLCLVQRFHDHAVEIPVHQIQVIKSEQRLQGHRIIKVNFEVTTMKKRIDTLEQDNTRLKGMLDVESQRFNQLQRGLSRAQRELRQMRRFRFYDRVRLGRLESCARRHLVYHH
ncbi:hypothetical protein Tco_0834411 [Tanacetum coccineum]